MIITKNKLSTTTYFFFYTLLSSFLLISCSNENLTVTEGSSDFNQLVNKLKTPPNVSKSLIIDGNTLTNAKDFLDGSHQISSNKHTINDNFDSKNCLIDEFVFEGDLSGVYTFKAPAEEHSGVILYNEDMGLLQKELKEKLIYDISSKTTKSHNIFMKLHIYFPKSNQWLTTAATVIPGYSVWPDQWWKWWKHPLHTLSPVENKDDYAFIMSWMINHMAIYQDRDGNISTKPLDTYTKLAFSLHYYDKKLQRMINATSSLGEKKCDPSTNEYYSLVIGTKVKFFHLILED